MSVIAFEREVQFGDVHYAATLLRRLVS